MHHTNNAVFMQTEQLGQIETLEKLHSAEGYIQDLEHKLVKQDHVLAQLMGDNLDHLQDNMQLTAHINSSSKRMRQLKTHLGQVGSVLMGMVKGVMEGRDQSLLEAGTSDASGSNQDDQGGEGDNGDAGASMGESMRRDSLMPWEGGLITEMERETMEGGSTRIQRRSQRAGVGPTLTYWSVRIKWGQLS